jgi:hypothetical protein
MSDSTATDTPGIPARAVTSVRRHPVVTAVLVLGALAAIGFSVLIGLPVLVTVPLLVVVGVGAWLLLRWSGSRRGAAGGARSGWVALGAVALSGLVTFGLIQLVPHGRDHSNPKGSGEPEWANAETRELMVDACYSCHSNEVDYPPYSSIAPISWATQRHVDEGREAVNYSDFATDPGEAEESVAVVEEGEMPPAYFTRFGLHPEADLTSAQVKTLVEGLRATPGMSEGGEGGGSGEGDGD